MRLIDADALKEELTEPNVWWETESQAQGIIDAAPTIDPVKHGKWIDKMLDNFRKYEVVCSECGARYVGNYDAYDEPSDFNYCPNCGARME